MRTIFVTSTAQSLTGGANPLDGGLFALDAGIAGRPDTLFAS